MGTQWTTMKTRISIDTQAVVGDVYSRSVVLFVDEASVKLCISSARFMDRNCIF